jgi:hypothetical protein
VAAVKRGTGCMRYRHITNNKIKCTTRSNIILPLPSHLIDFYIPICFDQLLSRRDVVEESLEVCNKKVASDRL